MNLWKSSLGDRIRLGVFWRRLTFSDMFLYKNEKFVHVRSKQAYTMV